MMASIQRTIGPAASASLFAFSLDNNILGENFIYRTSCDRVGWARCRCAASQEHVET